MHVEASSVAIPQIDLETATNKGDQRNIGGEAGA